jgi:ABC-type uncharacterized transport system auxiliary subunit
LSGCGQAVNYNKTQYVLDPSRPGGPVATSRDAVLEVRRFMIDSAFSGKGLVYRSADRQYEADFYHEFLVSPASMIREAARNWFTQSGLFTRVADPGSYVEPAFALEANVTALYGDLRDENNPLAVVELRAFLLKVEGSRDPVVVHSKTYVVTSVMQTQDPDGLVAAFNRCLQTILTDLETDLTAEL